MLALALLIFGPFLFLMTRSALGERELENSRVQKFSHYLFVSLIIFYLLIMYVGKHNYYIKGYRSTSILFIIVTISGLIYWLIDRGKVFNNFFRLISFCFTVLTVAISSCLFAEILDDYNNQLYYNDTEYRLEDTRRGINEPCMLPTLFVKNNFYEQEFTPSKISSLQCLSKADIEKIEIKYITGTQVSISYFLTNKSKDVLNPLQVIYLKD